MEEKNIHQRLWNHFQRKIRYKRYLIILMKSMGRYMPYNIEFKISCIFQCLRFIINLRIILINYGTKSNKLQHLNITSLCFWNNTQLTLSFTVTQVIELRMVYLRFDDMYIFYIYDVHIYDK